MSRKLNSTAVQVEHRDSTAPRAELVTCGVIYSQYLICNEVRVPRRVAMEEKSISWIKLYTVQVLEFTVTSPARLLFKLSKGESHLTGSLARCSSFWACHSNTFANEISIFVLGFALFPLLMVLLVLHSSNPSSHHYLHLMDVDLCLIYYASSFADRSQRFIGSHDSS